MLRTVLRPLMSSLARPALRAPARPVPVRPAQRGATMVEALVSVLVLSFGVLGAVGMQTASIQANREARNQSLALRYARDMAEMIHANPQGAAVAGAGYLSINRFHGTAPAYNPGCADAGGCTPTDLAADDVARWQSIIADPAAGGLPGVVATVCRDSAPYDANGLPVWDCTPGGAGDAVVIKLGWDRSATRRATTGEPAAGVDLALNSRPLVVLPVVLN